MSKEMREQINKVKNFGQFLNENNSVDDLIKDITYLLFFLHILATKNNKSY